MFHRSYLVVVLCTLPFWITGPLRAQSAGSGGTIQGVVTDPSGAVIPGAAVSIRNDLTAYQNSTKTDADGTFIFRNVPPNQYHFEVSASGFADLAQDLSVRSSVPVNLKIGLQLASESTQ